jgi:serine/threonine protein kinase
METELDEGAVVAERYRLLSILGHGGHSVVWAAEHIVTRKDVALKILTCDTPDGAERFVREAKIAAQIAHPSIVAVHDIFELDDASLVMVMDRLYGETLAARIERAPLAADELAPILVAVLDALEAAHAQGVVHRDLKPENVFLTESGVKVLDFGIAKWREPNAADAPGTATGTLLGTPHYMAPEQVFGESDVDARADIWALGVLSYEALTGCSPFDGENVGQVFRAIAQKEPAPLPSGEIPSPLRRVIVRALSKDRQRRPSLTVFREALTAPLDSNRRAFRGAWAIGFLLALSLPGALIAWQRRQAMFTKVEQPNEFPSSSVSEPNPPATAALTPSPAASPTAAVSTSMSPKPATPPPIPKPAAPRATASGARLPGGIHAESPY